MSLNFSPDDWDVFDFQELISYTPDGESAIVNVPAIRRPITKSAARNIEQFDIGSGLTQTDIAFHIDAGPIGSADLTAYDFSGSASKDQITDADNNTYDVIFVEQQIDRQRIMAVGRMT